MRRAFFICACKIKACELRAATATRVAFSFWARCKPKAKAPAESAAANPMMDITPAPAGRATMKVDPLQTALVCVMFTKFL